MRKMMNNAVCYSKRRRLVNQCLDKGMSLRKIMQTLKDKYTGFNDFGLTTLSKYAKKRKLDRKRKRDRMKRVSRNQSAAPMNRNNRYTQYGSILSLREIETLTPSQQLWLLWQRIVVRGNGNINTSEHIQHEHASNEPQEPVSHENKTTIFMKQEINEPSSVQDTSMQKCNEPVMAVDEKKRARIRALEIARAAAQRDNSGHVTQIDRLNLSTEDKLTAKVKKALADVRQARKSRNCTSKSFEVVRDAERVFSKAMREFRDYFGYSFDCDYDYEQEKRRNQTSKTPIYYKENVLNDVYY